MPSACALAYCLNACAKRRNVGALVSVERETPGPLEEKTFVDRQTYVEAQRASDRQTLNNATSMD